MKQPPENYKDVSIGERTFRIRKFDARTGSFMLVKIIGIIAPLFKNVDTKKLSEAKEASEMNLDAFNISGIMSGLGELSEKDFEYIQTKCLQRCGEVLNSGVTSVLNEDGTFGAIGLEEDTMTVIALTAHTLMFNVQGFFQGSPLSSIMDSLLTTSPRNS